MSRTLFVSDVHLRPNDRRGNRPFHEFLEIDCDALYIVGDLFDFWIGPRHLDASDYRRELEALRDKASRSRVYFIHGNRDYMVEGRFERATGITVLGDQAQLRLDGRSVALAHGDFIFNRNSKYAAYRAMMRSRPVVDLWLQLPAFVGKALGRGYRKISPLTTPNVEWTREELLDRARPIFRGGADVLICGHIHRPQHLTEQYGGRRRDVYVLGDWCGGTQDYVVHDGRDFQFLSWPVGS